MSKKLKVLALIPARSGSKGLKNKNIKKFNNKPMMFYTIKAALDCKICNKVFVSTDSKIYKNIALNCGASVPFLRSSINSSHKAKSINVVIETISNFKKINQYFDILILLQPTSPLRDAKDILRAYRLFLRENINFNGGAKNLESKKIKELEKLLFKKIRTENFTGKSLASVNLVKKHPNLMREIMQSSENYSNKNIEILKKLQGFDSIESNRQNYSKIYEINGAIYINFISQINERTNFNDNEIPFVMPIKKSIDIDDEIDFLVAKNIFKN